MYVCLHHQLQYSFYRTRPASSFRLQFHPDCIFIHNKSKEKHLAIDIHERRSLPIGSGKHKLILGSNLKFSLQPCNYQLSISAVQEINFGDIPVMKKNKQFAIYCDRYFKTDWRLKMFKRDKANGSTCIYFKICFLIFSNMCCYNDPKKKKLKKGKEAF